MVEEEINKRVLNLEQNVLELEYKFDKIKTYLDIVAIIAVMLILLGLGFLLGYVWSMRV